jgi:hypothetical protein
LILTVFGVWSNTYSTEKFVSRHIDGVTIIWHQYSGMRVILYSSITSKRDGLALQQALHSVIGAFKWWNQEIYAVSSRKCTVSQINQNDGKIAFPSTVFSRSRPLWLFLFADIKKMLAGKKFSTNEEVIAETTAYFERTVKMVQDIVRKELSWIIKSNFTKKYVLLS